MKPKLPLLSLALAFFLVGCGAGLPRKAPTLAPGTAQATSGPGGMVTQTVTQSEDALEASTQFRKRIERETIEIPEGSTLTVTNVADGVTNVAYVLLSKPSRKVREVTEETGATIGAAQDNTRTRGAWVKAKAAAEQTLAFMKSVRWLSLLGLLPLGILVFSFTPYGRAMAISKEGKAILAAGSIFGFMLPAMSKVIVDNALPFAILFVLAIVGWIILERKQAYKVQAALLSPPPSA